MASLDKGVYCNYFTEVYTFIYKKDFKIQILTNIFLTLINLTIIKIISKLTKSNKLTRTIAYNHESGCEIQ